MNRAAQFKKVTHVIFDLDGVLLDTERLYTLAIQNIVGKYGKTFTWEIKAHIMGLTGTEAAQRMVELMELPVMPEEFYKLAQAEYAGYRRSIETIARRFGKKYTPEIQGKVIGTLERESARIAVAEMGLPTSVDDFQEEFRRRAHELFRNGVPLMPGAVEVVKHLHNHKIPLAVATSSSQDSFNLKSKNHKDFFARFSHIVCGGSDPEVKGGQAEAGHFPNMRLQKVLDNLYVYFVGLPTNHIQISVWCLKTPRTGVKAAISAGMQVVMVPDENVPAELRKDAHIVVGSLDKAPLDLFGLPALKTC
ncbi:hypothetical protein NQ318_019789 [Aromia moschata]|uniref:Uncharacterized protein n=1 Tax=Aromia moschata TaxID=1265417 RepID=A0AAV8YKL6_9CUCU|nr:hypothetical protein NQ318_019789 [Aromia moschata]